MNMRAIAGKTIAAVTLASALTGIAAGVAEAVPSREAAYCEVLLNRINDMGLLAQMDYEAGDMKSLASWNAKISMVARQAESAGCL